MVRFRDFTKLPVGYAVFDSIVEKCPDCDRPGLIEILNGQKTYLHSETIGYADDGSPIVQWDSCAPKETPVTNL